MDMAMEIMIDTLRLNGWTIETSDKGVRAYRICRWCKGKRRHREHCSLCKGVGYEMKRIT